MITKLIDTAAGEVLVERMFEPTTDNFDRENSLLRIYTMQFCDATVSSYAVGSEYVMDAIHADKIAFA